MERCGSATQSAVKMKSSEFHVSGIVHVKLTATGPFLESPETSRTHCGSHDSLCIFKAKAFRGKKLFRYFNFLSLYNI